MWIALCCTDGVDGYLARRQGATRSGAFLDPLADKVLVLGAMFALVSKGTFWWPPVALIAVRELAISFYRTWAGKQGITIPARFGAKVKTVTQQVAVGLALLPLTVEHDWLWGIALWLALTLTLVTGAQYLLDSRRVLSSANRLPS